MSLAACVGRTALTFPATEPGDVRTTGDHNVLVGDPPTTNGDTDLATDPAAAADTATNGDATPPSDTAPSDAETGDPMPDGDSASGLDWRLFDPDQWPKVQAELDAAAAAGVSAAPSATLVGSNVGVEGAGEGWTDCVLAENGRVYCIPMRARHLLEIDPSVDPVVTRLVGPELTAGLDKWLGGTLHSDGTIFAVPFVGALVMRIDPRGDPVTVTTYDVPAAIAGRAWSGILRGYDGKLYGLPAYTDAPIMVIDPSGDPPAISWFGDFSTIALDGFNQTWGSGSIAPANGKFYLVPYGAQQVAEIDPVAQTAELIGTHLQPGLGDKWYGATLGRDGKIYGAPDNATTFLVIDPSPAVPIITEVATTAHGSDGLVLGPTGVLVAIPWVTGGTVFLFDPDTGITSSVAVTGYAGVGADWGGGALAPNGRIYAGPYSAAQVLEIDLHPVRIPSIDVMLGGYLSHY